MPRFLREPLLHFLVLGGLLFVLYGWLNRGVPLSPGEIVVSSGQMQSLQAQFARVWRRPPTAEELQGLVDDWVKEEILYREGLAMGLDRDDPVVRRRVGQKMEFMIEGQAPSAPSTAELQSWLDAHPDKYAVEPRYSLEQVYFDPARQGKNLEARILTARRTLGSGKRFDGDPTMLPPKLTAAPAFEVVRTFGAEFEGALKNLSLEGWQGPVRSGFGLHLVRLIARDGGRPAQLDEVRGAVERDLLHARTMESNQAFYRKLRANYSVRIEAAGPEAVSQK